MKTMVNQAVISLLVEMSLYRTSLSFKFAKGYVTVDVYAL